MRFNSAGFLLFFAAVYLLYILLGYRRQNALLLAASCFFYGMWDWRFLGLIFISVTTDYLCGLKMDASDDVRTRRLCLILSIAVNVGILCVFKYFNFFSANLAALLGSLGLRAHPFLLQIALPLGISFYTFKTMSYTIDVYTGMMAPTRNYIAYALYVIFFPQVAAGPIMRARDLLPQIEAPRRLSLGRFYEGSFLIYWGLFQKVFVADNLARLVDPVFAARAPYNGFEVIIALYAFAFQIYADFAGYSNIATGLARCMGFETTANFNLPYFSTNPQAFWKRWHMTLSSWLHDYIFTPIAFAGRGWGNWSVIAALSITFLLCGLWHGAAWTFVIWGAYQAALLIGYTQALPLLPKLVLPGNMRHLRVPFFFSLVCLGWLVFRAGSLTQAKEMLTGIFRNFHPTTGGLTSLFYAVFFTWFLIAVECVQYRKGDLLCVYRAPLAVRALFYVIIYYAIVAYGRAYDYGGKEFLYFQF